jgi:leucyl-tRNA synthetase
MARHISCPTSVSAGRLVVRHSFGPRRKGFTVPTPHLFGARQREELYLGLRAFTADGASSRQILAEKRCNFGPTIQWFEWGIVCVMQDQGNVTSAQDCASSASELRERLEPEANRSHPPYDPARLEAARQHRWKRQNAFATPAASCSKKSTYVYACTPFTTGKAHMGHVRSYTLADVCARRARSLGHAVLWAMGFDAFGLPNELAATERSVPPDEWVRRCQEHMTTQFDRLGLSVDWSRCFVTSSPEYYRWTQWVFLRLLERKLAYRAEGIEHWCSTCDAVLATMQVTDEGCCWRCGSEVELTCVAQWYLRILPYADELERNLSALGGWDDAVLTYQRNMLAPTVGVEFTIPMAAGRPLVVFAPKEEAIADAAFIAVSPNHPDLAHIISTSRTNLDLDMQRLRSLRRQERSARLLPVAKTSVAVTINGFRRPLPVVVTPIVDMRFGGGAYLGTPICDKQDAAIASQCGLSVPLDATVGQVETRPAKRYKLRDNSISRQRSWGAPVPVVHCPNCGQVPVPDESLPVSLPQVPGAGAPTPLAAHPTFSDCKCPHCHGDARRDTDTLDVHMDSIWMLIPFCVPSSARATQMFTHADLERWLPVAQVVCGADQVGWWINDRLCFKALCDSGYLPFLKNREPVVNILTHEMVLAGGRKMSKSLGNAVDPDDLLREFGADVLRLTVLKVNPRKAFNWSTEALIENRQFLTDLWDFVHVQGCTYAKRESGHETGTASHRRKLARWTQTARRKIESAYERQDFHLVLRELKVLFGAISQFAKQRNAEGVLAAPDAAAMRSAIAELLDELEPLAPHICEELKEVTASADRSRQCLPELHSSSAP